MNTFSHKELTQDDVDMYFFYRKHGVRTGFFDRYFCYLRKTRTTVEAFNATNDEYFDLFGEFRFSSLRSFRNSLKIYLEK